MAHFAFTLIMFGSLVPTLMFAQSPTFFADIPVTNDFLVSPANKELLIKPGETKSFSFRITNRTGGISNFFVDVEDIDASNYGDLNVASSGHNILSSARNYLKYTQVNLVLAHGETVEIPVTIALPSYVADPSLYALLTITARANIGNTDVGTGARILSRIGIPVLVRTSDERKGQGRLVNFGTADGKSFFTKSTISFKISYENIGDVHIRPYGKITFRNSLGRITEVLEVEPWYVLPGVTRSRVIDWPSGPRFGYYSATLTMEDGFGSESVSAQTSLWILPYGVLTVFVFILIAGIIARGWIKRKGLRLKYQGND